MHRLTLRFSVALITFVVGVMASVFWVMYYRPNAKKIEKPFTQPPTSCFPGLSVEIKAVRSTPEDYFPTNVLDSDPYNSKFFDSSYSKQLTAMDEPSLLQLDNTNDFHLRFLWLRSFHVPVTISLQRSDNKYTLTVKQVRGRSGTESSELAVNKTRILTNDEWSTFSNIFEGACFWNTPSYSTEPLSTDGAWWVLECVWQGRYHIVNHQSPENGPYRQVCLYLLRLSDLEINSSQGEVY